MSDRHRFTPLDGNTAYETLGIAGTAGPVEVTRAFRRLMRTAHTDYGGDPELADRLIRAEHWLRFHRSEYDQYLDLLRRDAERSIDGPQRADADGPTRPPAPEPSTAQPSAEDESGSVWAAFGRTGTGADLPQVLADLRRDLEEAQGLGRAGNHAGAARKLGELYRRACLQLGDDHDQTLVIASLWAQYLALFDDPDEAVRLLRQVVDLHGHRNGLDHLDTFRFRHHLARVTDLAGYHVTAHRDLAALLVDEEAVLGSHHLLPFDTAAAAASALIHAGRPREAHRRLETLISRMEAAGGDAGHLSVRTAMFYRAVALSATGRSDLAAAQLAEVAQAARQQAGNGLSAEDAEVLSLRNYLATDLIRSGHLEPGARMLTELLAPLRRVFGDRHPVTLIAAQNLGAVRSTQGSADAVNWLLGCRDRWAQVPGRPRPARLLCEVQVGAALIRAGRPRAALAALQKADRTCPWQGWSGWFDSRTSAYPELRRALAQALLESGQVQAALGILVDAERRCAAELESGHPTIVRLRIELARARIEAGAPGGDPATVRRVHDEAAHSFGPGHLEPLVAATLLAEAVLRDAGPKAAVGPFRAAVDGWTAARGTRFPQTLASRLRLLAVQSAAGHRTVARRPFSGLLGDATGTLTATHPVTLAVRLEQILARERVRDTRGAVEQLRGLAADCATALEPRHPLTSRVQRQLARLIGNL